MVETLAGFGYSVPAVQALDAAHGLAIIEDFGDRTFGPVLATGVPTAQIYAAATDVLADLAPRPVPAFLPLYDLDALLIEAGLLLDWYWPLQAGTQVAPAQRGGVR